MNVTVKKSVLFNFLKRHLQENRTDNPISGNFISPYNIKDEEDLIKPSPHMATQLSVEEPPVGDEEYVPASSDEASILLIIIHSGIFFGVTFSHVLPLSFVRCINPSSLPTHIKPSSMFDSSTANIVA